MTRSISLNRKANGQRGGAGLAIAMRMSGSQMEHTQERPCVLCLFQIESCNGTPGVRSFPTLHQHKLQKTPSPCCPVVRARKCALLARSSRRRHERRMRISLSFFIILSNHHK